ncbi:MAG: asparaginase, partial [Chloroflexi bacterium]|nr:asparaginase [Chloroflexota bacterium]
MPRVHILATGGTIAMAHDERAGGAVLSLSGTDFLQRLSSLSGAALPEITVEEYGLLPSSHFTVDYLWGMRQRVMDILHQNPPADGVVLTHGTDSLEETAYLLDLTVPGEQPMVLTGAMRVASQAGYEGMGNLLAAIQVA